MVGGRSVQADLAKYQFPVFCEYVHGDTIERILGQRTLCDHLMFWQEELQKEGRDSLIIAPPESIKSTLLRWYMEWVLGKDRDITMLYVMNTATQAMRQNVSIQETITKNTRYREVFPDVIPAKGKSWSQEATFIERQTLEAQANPDPSIFATGWDGPYQGLHPKYILLDDLTNQTDVTSDAVMRRQRDLLVGVLSDRRQRGGTIKAIWTRWGEQDLTPTLKDMGFKIIQQPVEGEYPWGRLLCPLVFPDDRIQEIRDRKVTSLPDGTIIDSGLFPLTYMCNPQAASGSMVKRDWWRFYNAQNPPEFKYIIHSWDLSTGRRGGDFSAYGAWGCAENGYYLIDAGHWRLEGDELLTKMKLLAARDMPRYVLVEDSSPSVNMIQTLEKHTNLPLKPEKPGTKDKIARLKARLHLIEVGRVWLPNGQKWVYDFIDEVSSFPGGRYDDQVDQLSQALKFFDTAPSRSMSGGGAIRAI